MSRRRDAFTATGRGKIESAGIFIRVRNVIVIRLRKTFLFVIASREKKSLVRERDASGRHRLRERAEMSVKQFYRLASEMSNVDYWRTVVVVND